MKYTKRIDNEQIVYYNGKEPKNSHEEEGRMIKLFPHNQTAYEAAEEYLQSFGRAAVVHPTGTGKSYIAFKLCEDHRESRICWLSPSEYIFRTQLENIHTDFDFVPENIVFYTYAALMRMEETQLSDIMPDYIILDEFHRCGAQQWGLGVQRLLACFPDCPVLGLSATNIRYLDNHRDMAEELFNGRIASRMTLGEAIVLGVLKAPVYVTALFRYQETYEKYVRRVRTIRSKKTRDQAELLLEQLKRTLENAEGIDRIFERHMKERHGKYLVFCANKEHMDAMRELVAKWFHGIDDAPHVYRVYSKDPETSREFQRFKADQADHLRLLFCIDMLNEGIHVEDIAGVILLRPTVSPVVYKQQIGRAMSVASENAVIFDIVDNISGLTSIDFIQEEMAEILEIYRLRGEEARIVSERFTVIDEVQECRRLFDELEHTMSASWEQMYEEARKYYMANGDLLPPQSYVTPEGYRLGQWVMAQRSAYHSARAEQQLTGEQIQKLEAAGMCWDTYRERQWEEQLARARAFYEKNGHLDIPAGYVDKESGYPLGRWYRGVRDAKRRGTLSAERQRQLESIGIQWDSVKERNWLGYYRLAEDYYRENGNLEVHLKYQTASGVRLGVWISGQRDSYKKGRLTQEQISMLEDIGMSW
ncbi:MAG: Helicase associated domain protein [Muribaculaceae bacterium]|nr:Helicase associated domain protein [Muribaculaceae bacterium]